MLSKLDIHLKNEKRTICFTMHKNDHLKLDQWTMTMGSIWTMEFHLAQKKNDICMKIVGNGKHFLWVFFSIFILFLNNLKPRTLKPLKQVTEETFRDTDISNKLLNRTLIAQETVPRTNRQIANMKLKCSCKQKVTANGTSRKPAEWGESLWSLPQKGGKCHEYANNCIYVIN